MGSRLDRWVSLMRMMVVPQAEMIAGAPEEVRYSVWQTRKAMDGAAA